MHLNLYWGIIGSSLRGPLVMMARKVDAPWGTEMRLATATSPGSRSSKAMSLDNISRIRAPSTQTFWRKYLWVHRPVVIRNLYAGQPIAKVQSWADVDRHFGGIDLRVSKNYYDCYGKAIQQYRCTLRDYHRLTEDDPSTPYFCIEQAAPRTLTRYYRIPECARVPNTDTIRRDFFVAAKGLTSSIHFDGDQRHVLLTQVSGRKRVVLIHPRYAKRLLPVDHFCATAFQNYSEREKKRFLKYFHAYETVLNPGDTVYIPKLWWHYTEYLDFGMTFNVRFGRTPYDQLLATLPRHYYLQNISLRLVNDRTGATLDGDVIDQIFRAYFSDYPSPAVRRDKMVELYGRLYRRLCPDSLQGTYISRDFDPALPATEKKVRKQYNPVPFRQQSGNGPITAWQRRVLADWLSEEPRPSRRLWTFLGYNLNRPDELTELGALKLIALYRAKAWWRMRERAA